MSSVSVRSNVPGYHTPKCFVTDGDPNGLISEFIQYLVSISTKSSSVFEAFKTARGPKSRESHEDRLAQILVNIQEDQQTESEQDGKSEEGEETEDQSRDIDLMASDDEDDE